MQQLKQIIEKLKLNVLSIEDVPDSFSSTVYKIKQVNQQIVYLKIPYSKVKLEREYEAIEILSDEKLRKFLPNPDGPSFIHMDFRPANIIIQNNQVSGIIDFESARFGSAEMDFTKINRDIFMKNPRTLEAYQKGYKTIRPLIDLDVILPFYRFTDAFNSLGWCKKRGIKKHQQFFNENYVILKSILMNEQ